MSPVRRPKVEPEALAPGARSPRYPAQSFAQSSASDVKQASSASACGVRGPQPSLQVSSPSHQSRQMHTVSEAHSSNSGSHPRTKQASHAESHVSVHGPTEASTMQRSTMSKSGSAGHAWMHSTSCSQAIWQAQSSEAAHTSNSSAHAPPQHARHSADWLVSPSVVDVVGSVSPSLVEAVLLLGESDVDPDAEVDVEGSESACVDDEPALPVAGLVVGLPLVSPGGVSGSSPHATTSASNATPTDARTLAFTVVHRTTRSVSDPIRASPRDVRLGWEPRGELRHSPNGCDVG